MLAYDNSPLMLRLLSPNIYLYYLQRAVTQARVRRMVAALIAAAVNMRIPRPVFSKTEAHQDIMSALRRDGLAYLPPMIRPSQLDEMEIYLKRTPVIPRGGCEILPEQGFGEATIADVPLACVISCPHVMALATHPFLINLAVDYLGCLPTISTIGIRWSLPGGASRVMTEHFHRDPDDWRFFKFFMYLTDVDDGSGPHLFVRGSHNQSGSLRARRFGIDEIDRAYGTDSIIAVTGSRGTNFIADTYGIHAGPVPKLKPRLMLEIGYSTLPIFAMCYKPVQAPQSDVSPNYPSRLLISARSADVIQ